MPVRVSARVDERQLRRVRDALGVLEMPRLRVPVTRFLHSAALLALDNVIHDQIIGGGRFKVGVGPRGGKILESAPPHRSRVTSRSGELRRSYGAQNSGRGVDSTGIPKYVDVGSDLVYAPVHELGLRGYPVRAHLVPGVLAVEPRFPEMLRQQIARELAAEGVPT